MGDAFIVRRGGGINDAYAVIAATYPPGSVCTCSKSGKTLTAKGTGGIYLFLIPEKGTWTVHCTNGTMSKDSDPIVISSQYQFAQVSLSYTRYLFANGVKDAALGNFYSTGKTPDWRMSGTNLYALLAGYTNQGYANCYCGFENSFDVTAFSKLKVHVESAFSPSLIHFGLSAGNNASFYEGLSVDLASGLEADYEINLTGRTGNMYFGLNMYAEGGYNPPATTSINISEMRLE